MEKPFISVIIPSLNEEDYIENTLRTLRNQDYKGKYEIILADAMSTDKTVQIAKGYTDRIITVKRKGIAAGKNAGAKVAKGNILLFIDSDTLPSPNLLSNIAKAYQNGEVVGVTCKLYALSSKKSIRTMYKLYNKFMHLSIKFKRATIPGICNSFRKDAFDKLGGFNENLTTFEDVDLSHRANKVGKIILLPNSFVLTSDRRVKNWGVIFSFFIYLFYHFKFFMTGNGFPEKHYKPVR